MCARLVFFRISDIMQISERDYLSIFLFFKLESDTYSSYGCARALLLVEILFNAFLSLYSSKDQLEEKGSSRQ